MAAHVLKFEYNPWTAALMYSLFLIVECFAEVGQRNVSWEHQGGSKQCCSMHGSPTFPDVGVCRASVSGNGDLRKESILVGELRLDCR